MGGITPPMFLTEAEENVVRQLCTSSEANEALTSLPLGTLRSLLGVVDSLVKPSDETPPTFAQSLARLINEHSMEVQSHTPDFILAEYLRDCLATWNKATVHRDRWYNERRDPTSVVLVDKETPDV